MVFAVSRLSSGVTRNAEAGSMAHSGRSKGSSLT